MYCQENNKSQIYKNKKMELASGFLSSYIYLDAAVTGVIRACLGLLIEHPLECIKTQWQNKFKFTKSLEIIKDIYKEKGILGFYRGFITNLIKSSTKQIYRWPLMIYFPSFYQLHLPNNLKKRFDALPRILTGKLNIT